MNRSAPQLILTACAALLFCGTSYGEPVNTPVTIRVQSHDAKFIGSGVGELNVRVENADTGEVLASGRISGGTGDTDRLIKNPISRGAPLADEKTASYVARLALERPTRVRIIATGPLAPLTAAQELSVTTWVVPGRPIGGDGIVLKLPGLIVAPVQKMPSSRELPLVADVTLMCGCPITDGGLWNARDYEVKALVSSGNRATGESSLAFTGETNRFAGTFTVPAAGRYDVTVWAHNSKTGNTGAARYTVDVP